MTKAALYWHPDAYDTSGAALMGRQSAGESFLRGYIRHGAFDRLSLWNATPKPAKDFEPLLKRIAPVEKPVDWIGRADLGGLAKVGLVNLPVPGLGPYAWARETLGSRAFSICGVTHTTVTSRVLAALNEFAIAPVQPWDALVCTSRAVLASLQVQAEMLDEHLKRRLGATRIPRPRYAQIPLGINTDDFQTSAEQRTRWRTELGIAEEDVVVLYVGRFNITAKMHPTPMALALEAAAAKSQRRVHWVLAGWCDPKLEEGFRKAILDHCLNLTVHFVDGRKDENRFSIWSVGDIFLSLSDNVQETFGLTPVEAMAAGLPSVISDWDGYKDLLRHNVDGFRIATYTPAAGLGRDLALGHSQEWSGYDSFVGSVAQFTAVDIPSTTRALSALIDNPDLRARMGAAAAVRAREAFDWKVIIPQYEALWAELNAIRRAAPPEPPKPRNVEGNPWRPDPFRMFAGYPTEWLTATTMLAPGMMADSVEVLMKAPAARLAAGLLPQPPEVAKVIEVLNERRQCTVAEVLSAFPPPRRPHLERGLVWMAKYGLVNILPRSELIPN